MNLSIARKVNFLSVGTILLFGVIVGWYFIRQETHALQIELDERAAVLLTSLAIGSEYPVLVGDRDSIEKLVKGVLKQKDVVFCRIEDKKGELLFQAGAVKTDAIKVYHAEITAAKTADLVEDLNPARDGKDVEIIGKIFLTLSLASLEEKITDITKAVTLIVFFIIIFVSLTSSVLLKFILDDPISRLVEGTERLAKGDLFHKVMVKSNDEIGKLGASFNKMTDDLQRVTVSRDYVDNIIHSLNDTLIVINPDKTIRSVNSAVIDLLEYTEEELIDKPVTMLFEKSIDIFNEPKWSMLLQKGALRDYETHFITNKGEAIPVSFSSSVMRNDNRDVISIVGIARDMREMLKLKRQLFQTEKMAAVGQLAGGVAHEINNPMSVILGFSQTVSRRLTDKNDPLYMPLKSIEREAMRCKKMIGDLLTFSRVSKAEKEQVSISDLLNETVSLIDSKCKVKDIKLEVKMQEDIPLITANKNQIQQVVVNICNNAIDAIGERGGRILIEASVAGEEAQIQITDTGEGIPAELKERIFEPFFTTKEVGKGTGLGLSISYEIIQKHGGSIHVESEQGKGAVFTVTLPLKQ